MATFFFTVQCLSCLHPYKIKHVHERMSKQKMFSVIPLFPQNSCPLATALEMQISSFEVVNNYIGLWSC